MAGVGSFDYLHTLTEIAFIYRIDTSTVRKKISRGEIKVGVEIKKFGGTWVMTEQAMIKHFGKLQFEDYIANHRDAEFLYNTGQISLVQKYEMQDDSIFI